MAAPTRDRPALRGRAATPPGWYDDPGHQHHLRYWDGDRWTDGVADGTTVTEDPLPDDPSATADPAVTDDRARLPGRAVAVAAFGAVVGYMMGFGASRLSLSAWPQHRALAVAFGFVGLWTGLAGGCWMASAHWGTGNVFRDLGLRAEGADVIRGFIASFAARLASVVVLLPIFLVNRKLIGSNVVTPQRVHDGTLGVVVLAVCAVIGAPIIEELFFRGLLMRAFVPVLGGAGAVIAQAVVFALAHVNPVFGRGNIGIAVGILVAGLVFGYLARRSRRLGPSMFAHGFFNLVAMLPFLLLR